MFFFKQKTAYEMRISDWSSDVCSSDLCAAFELDAVDVGVGGVRGNADERVADSVAVGIEARGARDLHVLIAAEEAGEPYVHAPVQHGEIGRASCRERVCQYV